MNSRSRTHTLRRTMAITLVGTALVVWQAQAARAATPAAASDLYGPPSAPQPSASPSAPAKLPSLLPESEPREAVREIVVHGNQHISDDRVLLAIPIRAGDKVSRADVLDAIQRIYGLGFFQDVKEVSQPVPGGVRLVFNVVENPILTRVDFSGVTKVPLAKLAILFKPQIGDVINYQTIKDTLEKVQKAYIEAGYPLARVADMAVAPGGALHVRIAEGTIHAIKVAGNDETKDYVILREMTTRPGEVFNADKMKADLRRIYNLNYFDSINLRFEPAPDDETTVVIAVTEKQTGSLNLGAGYSTEEGILGMLSIKKDNLFGTGQSLGLDFSISQYFQTTGELTYFNPWIDNQHTSLGSSLYLRRYNNFLGDFREDSQGVSVNVGRGLFGDPITSPWRGTLGLTLERISTFDNVFVGGNPKPFYTAGDGALVGQPITLSATGVDTSVGAAVGLSYDTRDILMNPTEGTFDAVSLEPALLDGTSPLMRGTGAFNQFFPMPPVPWDPTQRTTIAVGLRLGMQGGSFVPAYQRFYATGPYLIRGWPEYVTPGQQIMNQYPVNFFEGDNAFVASLEYRFPLVNVISGVIFGDTGILWDNGAFNVNLLHSGYGAGLRLNTPLGPIRLDYGISGEPNVPGQFHFSIGQKF